MFYARAALNAKGKVTFGLRHIRESDKMLSVLALIRSRCFESISEHQQSRPYSAYNEIYIPKTIRIAQRI